MTAIDPDLSVDEIMRRWPATIRVFIEFRMSCVGCPVAAFHTLFDACEEHGVDAGCVLQALDSVARSGAA